MVGMHDLIVSPSSSSTSRSTPCVLGCWGPMLTVIVSVGTASTTMGPFQAVPFEICPEFLFADLERLVGLRHLADLYGIVLALRMSFPIVRHEQAPKIRMTV